jgi:hypothetical protein
VYLNPLPIYELSFTVMGKFWTYIDQKGENDCWLWTGRLSGDNGLGYDRRNGIFRIKGKDYVVSRLAYYLQTNEDPGQQLVLHNCSPNLDNNLCCNIKHLYLGTQSDNMLDVTQREGRGSKRFGYKLTHDQVREIRRLYDEENYRTNQLAEMFNITRQHVYRVVRGVQWSEIS